MTSFFLLVQIPYKTTNQLVQTTESNYIWDVYSRDISNKYCYKKNQICIYFARKIKIFFWYIFKHFWKIDNTFQRDKTFLLIEMINFFYAFTFFLYFYKKKMWNKNIWFTENTLFFCWKFYIFSNSIYKLF